jgi:ADP-ribose pyrophosphatase YjhB (NUDIX family)
MNKTPRVRASVLLRSKGKILLVKEYINSMQKELWLTPGGGVKFGESLKDAAKREFLEETGINVEVGRFIFYKEYIVKDKVHTLNFYFIGECANDTIIKTGEVIDVQFFSLEDAFSLNLTQITRELIKKELVK